MAHNIPGGTRKGSRYHRLDDIPTNTFTPRTYQIQLLDAALKKNTLLCLGCNQGKVFLALMVAKELASATRQPPGSGHKCTFYITDSEDEVDALYQTLPHHTDLQIGRCPPYVTEDSGKTEEEVMSLEPHHWHHLMESNNILLCHGPAFVTALQHNCISLTDVNLLIFDDCHRSVEVENHSYAEIVNHVRRIPVKSQPHILGVTTSIAGTDCSDPGKLRDTIASMEKTMNAYAETSMLILSERFGCRPRESVIQCEDNECDDEQIRLTDMLQDILEQTYDYFNDCRISVTEDVDNRDPTEIPIQVLSQCLNILGILGSWCTSSISEYFVMQLDKIVKYEKNDIHKKFLRCIITTLRFLTKVFELNFHPDYDVDELLEYTTPKVRELVKVLRNYKPEVDFMIISNDDSYDNDDDDFSDLSDDDDSIMSGSDGEEEKGHSNKTSGSSKPMHIAVKRTADGGHERVTNFPDEEEKNLCGIIFVENRYIAFGLNKVIEEVCSWDENLCFVKSCHITGQGLRGANGKQKTNRTYKRQEEALRKFRTQECNLVIATLELEEGIDIPKCNLVVRFDPPQDYRSYTLSKGRARARDALYVILLENETFEEFNSHLKVFKGIEQVLLGERSRKHVTGNDAAEEADDEKEDESEEDDDDDEDIDEGDILPPYKTSPSLPNSPHVTMQGAIALINRYCAKLPSDAFTHLTPHCRVEKLAGDPQMFVAFLRLPINSPIKEELKGPVMRSKKLAKMAVALKMCEKLHMKSELDDNLVPVGKEMFLYEEEEEWADEEDMAGQARPGTTKRKQYYIKKAADALVQSLPKPQEPCYLYLINLRLTGPITDEQNTRGRVIYAPEDTTQTLGILMAKPVPQMPYFPVYTRSGEVTASVDLLQDGLVFTEDEISQLLKFHHFLFSGVLHLEKDPMEFNADKSDVGCIVVPLNVSEKGDGQLDIEWKFVNKVIQFMKVEKRAGFSRKNTDNPFHFCIDDFKDAVVMPSYRNIDQPQHFYVAEIRRDLNPLSPFPSPELYKTFQDYYTTKYGLVITNTEQPLLDVDHTSARLNLLTPRYMNQKGVALPTSSAETKRARRENLQQKQILVPELCDVHVFPASLWRKTVCLPAILYRANYLLLAEELRCKISRETGIGVETLPDGFRFPQLDFGFETSPEKLKEADSNNSKKSSVSSSPDMKNIRNDVDPLKDEVDEKAEPEKQSSDVEQRSDLETSDVKEKQELCQTSPVNDEGTLGKDLKTTQEKIDSTPSSDSDSGILSSGSDTSIGLSNRAHNRDSPELSSVVCANPDSATDTETTELSDKSAMQISKQIKSTCNETNSLGPNLSPWCSNQDNICNMTSHGSSVPCSHGNDHDQCNILCTDVNVVAEPSYTSCVNEQPGKSSSTISTSVIISDCNAFTHTTSATYTSPCIISWADSPVTSSTCDSNNVPTSISTTNLPTAASVTITTQCSDQSDLISATSTFVGAKLDAASRLPFSSSLSLSSSSSLTSYSPMSSSDSSPATICSFTNETAAVDQKCLETNIPQSTSSCAMFSSPTMRDQNPTVSSNGNVTHSLSSPAAANEASSQEKPEHTAPSSTAEPHKTNGCESLKGPLDSNALLREPYYVDDHKLAICDILSHTKQSSHHTDFTCTSDHPSNCHTSDLDITTSTYTSSQLNSKEYSEAEVEEKCKNNHDKDNISHIISGESSDDEMVHVCKEKHSSQPKRNTKPSPEVTGKPPIVTTPTSVSDESSSTSSSENPSDGEAAIIMNMLGQELSGLDIDLIIPQADTSETFHAPESQWGTTNSENKAWENMTSSWDKQWTNGAGNPQQNFENKHENSDKTTEEKESNDKGHAADADVIKFSFGTDKLEKDATCIDEWKTADKGGEEMDPSKDKCAKETKEDSPTHKVPKAEENTDSSVKSPSVQSASQRSTAEDNTASFDIGVWNTKKKRRDREESPNQFLRSPAMKPAEINDSASMLSSHLSLACNGPQTVSLDEDRDLKTFVGPSPCLIMQALTMSNANDFFSLERLETIGDSFLKYAITVYLYCSYPGIHEGKLSYLRSKQVSNYNLYRLGRRKCLAECMVSTKFEPYENWLPPGFIINEDRRRGPVPKVVIVTPGSKVTNASRNFYLDETSDSAKRDEAVLFNKELEWIQQSQEADQLDDVDEPGHTPYSLQLHHGLPDKSVADCVEALIGCYLTTCGRKAALMFMSWLGLKVLPKKKKEQGCNSYSESLTGKPFMWKLSEQEFDELRCPPSPMFSPTPENQAKLNHLLQGFDSLEEKIDYKFRDRSYLLQAFTHASYHYNTITDCYQRVEFLGDAILDYVITRHLYEDSQKYSPGILTDLRSALVNNNIFAALAVKWGFHKYFKAISPSLFHVIDKFVKRQKEKNQDDIDIDEEYRELSMDEAEPEEGNEEDDEEEEVEMEIPKALGDIFESVAGAIYLDSGMSLDTVWRVYYRMMKPHIDKYLKSIPKSPVRELLETEPETAKFERPERTMNGKVRVTVNVVGKGVFSGVGRNYRIAKSAAAKKALRSIRIMAQNLMG